MVYYVEVSRPIIPGIGVELDFRVFREWEYDGRDCLSPNTVYVFKVEAQGIRKKKEAVCLLLEYLGRQFERKGRYVKGALEIRRII